MQEYMITLKMEADLSLALSPDHLYRQYLQEPSTKKLSISLEEFQQKYLFEYQGNYVYSQLSDASAASQVSFIHLLNNYN